MNSDCIYTCELTLVLVRVIRRSIYGNECKNSFNKLLVLRIRNIEIVLYIIQYQWTLVTHQANLNQTHSDDLDIKKKKSDYSSTIDQVGIPTLDHAKFIYLTCSLCLQSWINLKSSLLSSNLVYKSLDPNLINSLSLVVHV